MQETPNTRGRRRRVPTTHVSEVKLSPSPTRSRGGAGFRLSSGVRDGAVALGSVGVVVFLIAYALSTPSVRVEAAVAAVSEHAGRDGVVHGRVLEAAGDPVEDAEVRLVRAGGAIRATHTGERGYFRLDVTGSCASYRIVFRVRGESERTEKELARELCPGDAVEIEARVVTDGQFIWVPIR